MSNGTTERARQCVRPPHPENDETQRTVAVRRASALSRFRRWVAYAPAERAPLPAIPAAWMGAEMLNLFHAPVMYPGLGTVAAAGLAYGLAHRREDDGTEKLSPGEIAAITGAAGGWLTAGDWAGPLSGGWPPWVSIAYFAVAGCGYCWLRVHASTKAAKERRLAAEKALADDIAAKTRWHQLAGQVGLKGSHLLRYEPTYLGDRMLIDVTGTRRRATQLATKDLEERLAEVEKLPRSRVEVHTDAIAGRMWINTRRRDPWQQPVVHPCASGQLDEESPWARYVPQTATVRQPLTIGIDPETGLPLQIRLWDPEGGKVISITAKKSGGKTTLMDSLRERLSACTDAQFLQINLSKALEDGWWAGLAAASALGDDANRGLGILDFASQAITDRPRAGRGTRVHQPTPDEPLYVLVLDEIDVLAGIPDAKTRLQWITSKCRSEGWTVVLLGQRNTAQWVGGGDVQSNIDIAVWGKFARDSRERGHVAGREANLPSMSEYGEGHPGVWGVTDLPPTDEYAKGRSFYWGEEAKGIRALIASREARRRPHRLEPALAHLQDLWDEITSPASASGGPAPAPAGAAPVPAGPASAPAARTARPDLRMNSAGQAVPGTASIADQVTRALDTLTAADETLSSLREVPAEQWAASVAQRQAQALAANYGDISVPAAALSVLIPLLAAPDGTTASEAGEALRQQTGSGSKSVAHRYLQALRAAGIARQDGSGRGARCRLASAPAPAASGPGLSVVPDD